MISGIPLTIFGQEFVLRFYALAILTGALAGAYLAYREAKRRREDPEIVWDLLLWLMLGGIVGARLWHVFTPSPSSIAAGKSTAFYLANPSSIFALWEGGLGIPGAVIGGAITLYIFARKYNLSFPLWADIIAPALALGQAIGRWGNFFNQELYGAPTDLPWKILIESRYRLPEFVNESYYHPLFLYESIWNLGNMFILLWVARRYAEKLRPGDVFLTYLIIYPLGRFLLDFLRLDASMLGGINANQTFMAIVALIAALALVWRHKSAPSVAPTQRDSDD
jgi:phosphatidylglycerol---prolipoprotein diacylglyceryl transferase